MLLMLTKLSKLSREGWTATLPSVERGINIWRVNWQPHSSPVLSGDWYPGLEQNWQPYSFPVWRGGAIVSYELLDGSGPRTNTNPISGFGSHVNPLKAGSYGISKNRKIVVLENSTASDFTGIDLENWHSPVVWMPLNGRWQARLDLFRGPYDSERRTGHWDCCFDLQSGIGMPTAKHFAQWGRKAEYKRGGGVGTAFHGGGRSNGQRIGVQSARCRTHPQT